MKIKYEFVTESVEIEVSDVWEQVFSSLDREETNLKRKESRRHCPIETYDPYDRRLPSSVNIEDELIAADEHSRLHELLMTALPLLTSNQRELLYRIYVKGDTQAAVAREEGVTRAAISKRLKRTLIDLKKIFQKYG